MFKTGLLLGISAVLLCGMAVAAENPPTPKKLLAKTHERIVCIGDSITDGNSYPSLLHQALEEAGYAPPLCMNAGVANDDTNGMRARVERDVLPLHPTLVTIMAGTNDCLHGSCAPAKYEENLIAIAERLKKEHVSMVLLTPPIHGGAALTGYVDAVHNVGKKFGYPVAEVAKVMLEAAAKGVNTIEADGVHPNFEGHRAITRALLDALGYTDVAVPKEIKITLFPGVITGWLVRPTDDRIPALDEKTVLAVQPDTTWKPIVLPTLKPLGHWWADSERQRGFAQGLPDLIGPTKGGYQGVAYLSAETAEKVYFNTGASLRSIWLNGKCLFKKDEAVWTGWHAGKERIPADLHAGQNTIVIEMGNDFFLSVTKDNDW